MSGTRIRAARLELAAGADPAARAEAIRVRAVALGVSGWVRGDAAAGGPLGLHAEGPSAPLARFLDWVGEMTGPPRACEPVRAEGHEQFGLRGVPAGVFVVQEHRARAHHFDLRLEVGGVMRSWAVPRGPSLDPARRRLAVQVADHGLAHNTFEGPTERGGGVIVWDRGAYEQGGRVPWPAALERGHAVFVLHGEKLRGGWALQRTRSAEPAQWLLLKRRDAEARPGDDVVARAPHSVQSGRTLAELLDA